MFWNRQNEILAPFNPMKVLLLTLYFCWSLSRPAWWHLLWDLFLCSFPSQDIKCSGVAGYFHRREVIALHWFIYYFKINSGNQWYKLIEVCSGQGMSNTPGTVCKRWIHFLGKGLVKFSLNCWAHQVAVHNLGSLVLFWGQSLWAQAPQTFPRHSGISAPFCWSNLWSNKGRGMC